MPAGGFGRLTEPLRDMYLEAGGIVVTGAEVARVVVRGGSPEVLLPGEPGYDDVPPAE